MSELRQQQEDNDEAILLESTSKIGRTRRRFQVDEGHRSLHTAYKYRIDFERFLDYVRIHDLDVLLDLGKEAIQELVNKYTKTLRDDPQYR